MQYDWYDYDYCEKYQMMGFEFAFREQCQARKIIQAKLWTSQLVPSTEWIIRFRESSTVYTCEF